MEFSAGGIVYCKVSSDYKIALILDTNSQWTFPKGHIEKGEKPEAAALRETEEEIGLTNLEIADLLEKADYWFKWEDNLIHKFVYFYLIKSVENNNLKHQEEEIQDAQWFSPAEALEKVGYKEQNQPILRKAYAILGISCESA